MNESRTSAIGTFGKAQAPAQKKCWIEIQLVDENGNPVADMNCRAENEASRDKVIEPYTGKTNSEGVFRIDNLLHPDLTLFVDAQALADEMESRKLSLHRDGVYRAGKPSIVKDENTGSVSFITVIGHLCDKAPNIPKWKEAELPAFHFPDPDFSGLIISNAFFNSRVVIKICPFRAWNILLHHVSEYSIINAYNLSLLSDFAYKENDEITSFFKNDCLDLSKVPSLLYDVVTIDVPFRERYENVVFLDTTVDIAEGGTQLFYVYHKKQIIVAWRGTELSAPADLETDFTFRPVDCPDIISGGRGHKGFVDAYRLAARKFSDDFKWLSDNVSTRDLFICGHSLGGALGLIQATVLKSAKPFLYTYGMPRIFCESTVKVINEIDHYRHVNDSDTITQIPFQMELDNKMYDTWGPLGVLFGFQTSIIEVKMQLNGVQIGDPYWHQGNIVFFFTAEQAYVKKIKRVTPLIGMDINSPYLTITQVSFKKAKLYLVPELNESLFNSSNNDQKVFVKSVSPESMRRLFPNNSNPSAQTGSNPLNHLMSSGYVPFIHNQLIELLLPSKEVEGKISKNEFISIVEESEKLTTGVSNAEVSRNKAFINLQGLLSNSLTISTQQDTWSNALSRFKSKEGSDE